MTDKQTVYRILDWDKHFENNRSRTLKRLDWVPVPTKQDGDGYTELVGHKDGAAHLGCWLAIVQVAARCHPRGTLLRSSGGAVQGTPMPHDCDSLSRMTRLPSETLSEAMQRLCIIGWLECLTLTATGLMTIRHDDGRHVPDERQGDAEKRPYMEWNGREEKGREQHTCAAKTPQPPTAAKPRERGPIWDTLCELFGLHPETDAECARLGKTVLLTTHFMDEAEALADRLAVLVDGRIVSTGTPDEVIGRYSQETIVRLRLPPNAPPPPSTLG
ncbi:hypothetical protein LCGC14_2839550, partial [marine sediment metagenome]